jgi:hypothetical protein
MFWLPLITVTAGVVGSFIERTFDGATGIMPWLGRVATPFGIGAVWLVIVDGPFPSARTSFAANYLWYSLFSCASFAGMYAAYRARLADE